MADEQIENVILDTHLLSTEMWLRRDTENKPKKKQHMIIIISVFQ